MAIDCEYRENYGSNVVTQKYSPLNKVNCVNSERKDYTALLMNRMAFMKSQNLFPQELVLATADWDNVRKTQELNTKPPIFVISSNRATWIAKGLQSVDGVSFTGPTDYAPVKSKPYRIQSPPLYAPSRTGSNRNVYIVVHVYEYRHYCDLLKDSGVTVIGWMLSTPKVFNKHVFAGFGASRFAAIEACKSLAPSYAWLMDDNVVAITNFCGYDVIEAELDKAKKANSERICAGFKGGTKAETRQSIGEAADKSQPPPTDAPQNNGLLQQVVCWNVAKMKKDGMNFSPMYLASAEDISFGAYLNSKDIGYFWYGGMGILKELPNYCDNQDSENQGILKLNNAKDYFANLFATNESATNEGQPSPVKVKATVQDAKEQTVSEFIETYCDLDISKKTMAKCQVVEQITSAAINAGFIDTEKLDTVFLAKATKVEFKVTGPAAAG